nr:reverse transcriptase domain-containing protein [Tanacetum cinerariifolium]
MEDKFYPLTVKGNDLKTYVRRFQELATMMSHSIEGNVTASKPKTLKESINIAQRLMDQVTKHHSTQGTKDHRRKFYDKRNTTTNNNHNNYHYQQQNRRQETFRAYAATQTEYCGYVGPHPLCKKCTVHLAGPCTVRCQACNKVGHQTRNCKNKGLEFLNITLSVVRGLQGGDEVVWLAFELMGGDGGACRLLGDMEVKVEVRSWC